MQGRQSGSATFTVMSVVTILSLTTLYLSQLANQDNESLRAAKSEQLTTLVQDNATNSAAVFKSLISPKQSAEYLPAIMASNYYDQRWSLVPNDQIETPNSRLLDRRSVEVKLPVFDESPVENVKTIMEGESSVVHKDLRSSRVTLVKTNFDEKGKLAISADIEVDSSASSNGATTEKTYMARVLLPAPIPFAPRLEIRSKGDSVWRNIQSLPKAVPGLYEFRVIASGIVYDASVELDGIGEIARVGGFKVVDNIPVISHGANNYAARDQVIGETFDYALDPNGSNAVKDCTYIPVDGNYKFTLKVNGPNSNFTAELASDVLVIDTNERVDSRLRDQAYSNQCIDKCPFIGPVNYYVHNVETEVFSEENYSDFTSFHIKNSSTAHYDVNGSKKLCINFEKAAAIYHHDKGTYPHSMSELASGNPLRPFFAEYYAYDLPSCYRKFLFQRKSCGCFAEQTFITLGDGKTQKSIRDIGYGDSIWNPVTKKAYAIRKITRGPEMLPMIRIGANSKDITVTGKHPFPSRSGFVTAHELKAGDEILLEKNWVKVDEVEIIPRGKVAPQVYNIELEASNDDLDAHNVLANGVVTGDLFIQTKLEHESNRTLSLLK